MDATTIFLVGAVMILAMGWGMVGYLRRPLKRVLLDVRGNEEHAQFWSGFSTVGMGLVTAIFALADQLKSGLLGLTGLVVLLGCLVARFGSGASREKPVS